MYVFIEKRTENFTFRTLNDNNRRATTASGGNEKRIRSALQRKDPEAPKQGQNFYCWIICAL